MIPSKSAAADPFVEQTILAAEAIWIAGGAQDDYINYWAGTPVQVALNTSIGRGVPIGGTSAGLAVLTQYVYSALGSKGVTSAQALADPYNRYITLAQRLREPAGARGSHRRHALRHARSHGSRTGVPVPHHERGLGPSPARLRSTRRRRWRSRQDGPATVASNVAGGSVYFLSPTETAEDCAPKVPLTFLNVDVYRVGPIRNVRPRFLDGIRRHRLQGVG